MANAWKRDTNQKLLTPKTLISLLLLSIILLSSRFLFSFSFLQNSNPNHSINIQFPIPPFDCFKCPQSNPIIANVVENLKYPFVYSIADIGNLPGNPNKNIIRLLKGKPFGKPDISGTIQKVLEKMRANGKDGFFLDVGANVGMASFAAAAMGFKVLAFEPVFENLQRICDGIWFNRVASLVTVFEAAASDRNGDITFHKLVGRLDNSAVSEVGARLHIKSHEIAVQVKTIPLDELIPPSQPILLIKIDVQGWEYHVLAGAKKLLSRKPAEAPYLIYEEDEGLLKASNSSSKEIRDFLKSVGYSKCTQHGTDAHCTKE
ncbi:hypothetical protein EUTSA_v10023596mg [Eutrema salsugineum]|uniref:Methyltransferase FkbM domain-containing protein n=1 Tax=Eutrema salsugineum TaxID=72664 RepID=V4KQU8_EUTSA|nr:uncharacterized protein LOC18010082 [Eutrema salsugineum]ESQ29723.1 hypothetical protein EUTSA_v10023596mg [Eutrema salsugineum]